MKWNINLLFDNNVLVSVNASVSLIFPFDADVLMYLIVVEQEFM